MGDVASLALYLGTFFLSALVVFYGHRRRNNIFVGLGLLLPVLLASFRYEVGTDYSTYLSLYDNLSTLSFPAFFREPQDLEFGFFLLVKLSEMLTNSPFLVFALSSALTILFFYLGLRRFNIKYQVLAYLLYLLIIFPMTLNIVRQGVAMSICFFALSFVVSRQPRKYILYVLLASLFHTTALLLLPVYFVNQLIKKGKENIYFIFLFRLIIFALPVFFLLPYVFNLLALVPYFEKYIKYQELTAQGNNYMIYIQFVIVFLSILTLTKVVPQKLRMLQFYFMAFAVLELLLTTLGFSSAFVKRSALYFSFFGPLLLTNYVDIFKDNIGKFFIYTLVVGYGTLYFYIAYFVLQQADIIPYHFYWR